MILSTQDNRCLLEVLPGHGGLCQRLALSPAGGGPVDVLAGCSARELALGNPAFRGVVLYPFPSRLDGGRYRWQGQSYRMPLNEPGRDNALHGLLFRVTPDVVAQEAGQTTASVTLRYAYDGSEPGYPFPGEVTVHYLLQSPGSLTMTLTVTNLHGTTVPVGVGWHPYFSLGGKVDDLSLQLPMGDRVETDARLLPTGKLSPFTDYVALAPIGKLAIDASLRLAPAAQGRVQALLWSPAEQVGLVLWQETGAGVEPGYRYLQVYISPDRSAIALEPVSCGIDAFNTGENLLALPPGELRRFTCGVSLVTEPGGP